jgi:UDPglucose 6-dehydrogenase
VGTPQLQGSDAADLRYVDAAVTSLLPHLRAGVFVIGKSTVPVGTAERLAALIEPTGAQLAWNPEFLREGFAVHDTIHPDRLVYGVRAPGASAETGAEVTRVLNTIFATALADSTPLVVTDFATAELVKVAANAFLATKISFINAMAEIAEVTGADVVELADAIGHDVRIGRRFLNAGVGFGGGCLPKDIRAFTARAEELGKGEAVQFLKEVDSINLRRRARVVDLVVEELGAEPAGKKVVVLGLAFKPLSDDVRDSPALDIAVALNARGVQLVATDPHAIANASRLHPELTYEAEAESALVGADVVVLVTEWDEYRQLDPARVKSLVRTATIIDGRNTLVPSEWRAAGWKYSALGRP